jgi:hypothetical protein
MVRSTHFFDDHPAIFNQCLEVNQEINEALRKKVIAQKEVSFDLILPFLFEDIDLEKAKLLSKELRLHREIVDCYNVGVVDVSKLSEVVRRFSLLEPVTYSQYQDINDRTRKLINRDLTSSYILSTERVYYRFEILDNLSLTKERKSSIIQEVRDFSAFLLFDDDVYDLESDIANEKSTILTQFLTARNCLRQGITEMTRLLIDGSNLFAQFTNRFKEIYQDE